MYVCLGPELDEIISRRIRNRRMSSRNRKMDTKTKTKTNYDVGILSLECA